MTGCVVGMDLGENSAGFASIICDEHGMPTEIHRLLVVLHDSGKDGMASGQTASVSRKASGGVARRARRLLRNRRRRSRRLVEELSKRGYPVVAPGDLQTYDAWAARADLLDAHVTDSTERRRLLSIAIRHMFNHRGWANAWVPLDAYLWKEETTPEFEAARDAAIESGRFLGLTPTGLRYQADLADLGLTREERLRPRNPPKPGPDAVATDHLLGTQRRVDVVREWRQICRVQQVPDEEFEALARIAFEQEKPKVPLERVGNDWLPDYRDQKRASIASLEHQEFQIRQTVANLGVRPSVRSKERRRLTVDEQILIVDTLMGITNKKDGPTWKDLAEEALGIQPNLLVHYEPDQALGTVAPLMRSVTAVNGLSPKNHPVLQWWKGASTEMRGNFIEWFADPAKLDREEELAAQFGPMIEQLDEKEFDNLQRLKFPSGRSAHCKQALHLMNEEMRRTGDTYTVVRNRLFNNGKDLRPMGIESLDTETDHPTLQRILPAVRRFLRGVENEVGKPDRVVIEHVRSAFLGFAAKQEAASRQRRNQRDRETAREDIKAAGLGIDHPTATVIKKFQAIRRQGSACLYCGATLQFSSTEMDHIVPRASGGNSTRANLVAVCRDCNADKGKQPFATFAETSKRPGVSVEAALNRVKSLERGELDARTHFHLKREMSRRLKDREEDEPIDERSLASTAYAATEMVRRINQSFDDQNLTKVYSGRIVSAARHASGIDKRIAIREGINAKSRFDRRHHAIDAAVAAMLNPSVARTLAEREDRRSASLDTGGDDAWKAYEGSSPAAKQRFCKWKEAMHRLADLVADAITADDVVVMQPVRYSAHHAALHEDGRVRHTRKLLGDAWSAAERAQIVDDRVYEAVSAGAAPGDDLPENSARTIRLSSGAWLSANDSVFLFPDKSARIALPHHSSAKLGSSIHHIRVYRWDDDKGRRRAGVVRVWARDLYDLVGGVNGDLLTAELPEHAKAVRRSHPKLREAMHAGAAEHVGTVMPGDELLLDPSEWPVTTDLGRFLQVWPETHWRVVGWPEDRLFAINPILLSQEGIRAADDDDPRKVAASPMETKVISDRVRPSASALWTSPGTWVIRRTALGRVRSADSGSGLPASWNPHQAVFGN